MNARLCTTRARSRRTRAGVGLGVALGLVALTGCGSRLSADELAAGGYRGR